MSFRIDLARTGLALGVLALVPACEAVTSFDHFHAGDAAGADGGRTGDGGSVDAGGERDGATDAGGDAGILPDGDSGMRDAGGDAGPRDAGGHDGGSTDSGNGGDACHVDVALTCAGRCGNVIDPTCSVSIDCGNACAAPTTCGGDGRPTYCGCTSEPMATTCALQRCGVVMDNCGRPVDCGNPCTGFDTCGGGGTPEYCGCTPAPDPCDTRVCGTTRDSCGGLVSCGTCRSGTMCCIDSCMPQCG